MFTNTSCSNFIYEINIPDDADNSLKKNSIDLCCKFKGYLDDSVTRCI